MESKQLSVNEETTVPGIYNYCDRWCERCRFQSRCRLISMDRELSDSGMDLSQILTTSLGQALKLLEDHASENSLDWEPPDADEGEMEECGLPMAEIRSQPLMVQAEGYACDVNSRIAELREALEELPAAAKKKTQLGLSAQGAVDSAAACREAFEVILRYRILICSKLFRALSDLRSPDTTLLEDANGSAKIALILIERSLEAWLTLREKLDPDSSATVDLILQLHRLSVMTEERFPEALDFQRPGFDE